VRLKKAQRSVAIASAALAMIAAPARAEVPHVVQPGETLWSIAAANNFTTRTIAAYNGLPENAQVQAGETIRIPSDAEGAAALASVGSGLPSPSAPAAGSPAEVAPGPPPPPVPPYWTAPIYCPSCPGGEADLASTAAAAWNAMRQDSLTLYGIDLYPAGPLSAYRSYAQQLYLYELYVSGQGNLAAEPGSSSHEYGVSVDLAYPSMRTVVDRIGGNYGWAKTEAAGEWWHVTYLGG
jgi:LysM repeat protein